MSTENVALDETSADKTGDAGSLSIRVVGAGTVGAATGRALDDWGHSVTFVDVDPEVLEQLEADGHSTAIPSDPIDADLVLVSVPTPYDPDTGTYHLGYLETAVGAIADQDYSGPLAIRSTMPPGTGERLVDEYGLENLAVVPEFLFADSARQDVEDEEQLIIGTHSQRAEEVIKAAFERQRTAFISLSPTEAEFAKLASNCFGAAKISFANEFWSAARAFERETETDIDEERMLSAFRMICPWHGPKKGLHGGRAYGGACLPKDTKGFSGWASENGIKVPAMDGVIERNQSMKQDDD